MEELSVVFPKMIGTTGGTKVNGALKGIPSYPNEFSHVVEKYWDCLPCFDKHPDFPSESPYCQGFSQASCNMNLDSFEPRPTGEAKQVDLEISEEAAIARLRPIQDAPDQWLMYRSSAATELGGSAPG
jgi:hypothetical protein